MKSASNAATEDVKRGMRMTDLLSLGELLIDFTPAGGFGKTAILFLNAIPAVARPTSPVRPPAWARRPPSSVRSGTTPSAVP